MTTRKWLAILALGVFFSGAVVDDAMARAGRSARSGTHRSMGWRGTRTDDSGSMQGITQNRRQPAKPATAKSQQSQQRTSWFQRNPFMAGLFGALAGTALFAMLSQAFGGLGGFGGGLMMLLLIGGLLLLAMRLFRSRRQPHLAGARLGTHGAVDLSKPFGGQMTIDARPATDIGAYRQSPKQGLAAIALETPTFTTAKAEDELSGQFFRIQEAWADNDRSTLQALMTADIYDHFSAEFEDMARRNERNVLKNIVVRGFDITEAWQDEEEEFISARIHARLIDYVERDGRIVEGSATEPTEFREAWTFARPRRGNAAWRLSAINQY